MTGREPSNGASNPCPEIFLCRLPSAAKDTYEYWSIGKTLPRINGIVVNLNPPENFNSPFLSVEHGSSKAVIRYPGHEDLVIDFK